MHDDETDIAARQERKLLAYMDDKSFGYGSPTINIIERREEGTEADVFAVTNYLWWSIAEEQDDPGAVSSMSGRMLFKHGTTELLEDTWEKATDSDSNLDPLTAILPDVVADYVVGCIRDHYEENGREIVLAWLRRAYRERGTVPEEIPDSKVR